MYSTEKMLLETSFFKKAMQIFFFPGRYRSSSLPFNPEVMAVVVLQLLVRVLVGTEGRTFLRKPG